MAENFDLIFGQNASQQYAWNDTDYQNGWETIGNIPPTAAQFDALQRRNDTKMKELNDELTPLVNADTADSRQPSTAYSVDDIKYSPLLPTGWFLTCTVGGTTSAGELVLPTPIAENDTVTDGTVTWEIHKIGTGNGGDGVPLGAIIAYSANGELPSGYLLCDGRAVSRTMFPDLFDKIGTTYGAGDGSTTFNLPNYSDGKFPEGSSVAGTVNSAGLPNIEGAITNGDTSYPALLGGGIYVKTGALQGGTEYAHQSASITTTNKGTNIKFDASLSNPIYGNSTTVQPYSLTCRYVIKAFDGVTPTPAEADISQMLTELTGKANINGSNMTYHKDVITTSGTYTAPATGLYKITVKGGGGGGGYGSAGGSVGGYCGGGGGEGGTTITYAQLTANDSVGVIVGAGGAGATANAVTASSGGDSSVTINGDTFVGGGGGGGTNHDNTATVGNISAGIGGTGTIPGAPGSGEGQTNGLTVSGGSGGGAGGGISKVGIPDAAIQGGGGAGATGLNGKGSFAGGAGGDGYVWFEYYTPGSN